MRNRGRKTAHTRMFRRVKGAVAAFAALLLGIGVLVPTAAHAADTADFAILKEVSSAGPYGPGDTFSYTITVTCRSGTADPCYDSVLTDVLPEPLEFVGANPVRAVMTPTGTPNVAVDADAGSFTVSPTNTGATDGAWSSGGTLQIIVDVQVPTDTDGTWDGASVVNRADIDAENTPPANSSAGVTLDVETTLAPSIDKSASTATVPAVPGRVVDWTVRPGNGSNQNVDQIFVQDPATLPGDFAPYLEVTGIDVTAPEVTASQLVEYYVGGTWTATLPDPVSLVEGVRATFDGEFAPDAAGEIVIHTVTTDAVTGIPDGDTVTVDNVAEATVTKNGETSDPETDDATVNIAATNPDVSIEKIFGDATLVSGQSTTATITATNGVQDVQTLTITEPSAGQPGFAAQGLTFDGFGDVEWPVAATSATITYTYTDCAPSTDSTTTLDTLPAANDGCTVDGFVVEFSAAGDDIDAGAYARIPVEVTALPVTDPVRVESTNHVDTVVENTAGQTGDDAAEAPFIIDPLIVDTEVSKTITPSWVWGVPGAAANITLSGKVSDDSTVGSDYLVISDPVDPTSPEGAAFWDAFRPTVIDNTDIPECTSLTLNYWSEDAGAWTPLPGATGITGPVEDYTYPIPSTITDLGGIQYVFTPTCQETLPPGFVVITNIGVQVTEVHDDTAQYTNDVQSQVDNENSVVREPTDVDDDGVEVRPIDGDGPDFVDKAWLQDDVPALSQGVRTARLLWSTQGLNISSMTITDPASAGEISDLSTSVYDAFDLVSIPAITPAIDPLIVNDRITEVSIADATGTWTDITAAACAAGCEGTFGGYTLTDAQSASTVGVRIVFAERTAGEGVGRSYDRRPLDLSFRVRDTLRSDPTAWALGNFHSYGYNTDEPGLVDNTVAAHGVGPGVDVTSTDSDTILILDRPINPAVTKTFDQDVLGLPDAGADDGDYPLISADIVATNQSAARVASIRISDPSPGQAAPTAYDVLDLHEIDIVSAPAGLTLADAVVTLTHAGAPQTYTVAEAEALTPDELADVTAFSVEFASADGRPVIPSGGHGDVQLTWQLRDEKRSGGPVELTQPGGEPILNEAEAFVDSPGRITCAEEGEPAVPGCSTGIALADDEFDIVAADYAIRTAKTIAPSEAYEDRAGRAPEDRTYTTTLTGQPLGTARTTLFTLSDTTATFWNTMDYTSSRISVPRPINQIALDVLLAIDVEFTEAGGVLTTTCGGAPISDTSDCWTIGDWQDVVPGAGADIALPAGVDAADVVGVRYRAQQVEGGSVVQWERPFNPTLNFVLTTERRDTLRSDDTVEVSTTRLPANPGETDEGVISNDVQALGVAQFGPTQTFERREEAADDTIVRHRPNSIQVTKDRGAQYADPTRNIPYVVTVVNTGSWDMTDVTIIDQVETDATGSLLVEPDPAAYTFALSGPGVTDPDPGFTASLDEDTGILEIIPPDGFVFLAGSTLRVETPLQFRADVTPAEVVENDVTVSADRPFETCEFTTTNLQPGTPTTDVDECTASTSVAPLATSTLSMKKFVKGDLAGDPAEPTADDLGVLNVVRGPAEACDASQTGVTDDGYYSYPCVPITRPGGRADWRLDLTNTGNTPAKVVAGIDTLPAVGDHPVVAPGSRGSQFGVQFNGSLRTNLSSLADSAFATGTLLLSPVQLSQACNEAAIKVLTEDGPSVPGCEFGWVFYDQATDEQIAAARTLLFAIEYEGDGAGPAPGLRPGETLRVTFETVTPYVLPAEAAVAGGDPVAYNSFAAATRSVQTTQPERASLVSEPQKVGIATATGQLELRKTVVAPDFAGDITLPDSYPMLVTCTSGGEAVTLLTAAGGDASRPVVAADGTVYPYNESTGPVNLPLFSECVVTEDPVPAGVTVTVTPEDGVIAERDLSQGASVWNPYVGDVSLSSVEIVNEYAAGGFTVSKTVDSDAVDQDGTPIVYTEEFSFEASCLYDGQQALAADDRTFTLTGGQERTFTGIPAGAECTVTETDAASSTGTTVSVAVGDGGPVEGEGATAEFTVVEGEEPQVSVSFVNAYETGSLDITKQITGSGAALWGAGPFEMQVTCTFASADPTTVYDGAVEVSAASPTVTIDGLPVGASCVVEETDDGGATETSIVPADGTVEILGPDAEESAVVVVTNDFRTGAFSITKEVEGPGAPAFSDGPFTFTWECVVDGDVVRTGTLTLEGDGSGDPLVSEVVRGIPVGATCTIEETDTGYADETPPPVTITIEDQTDPPTETVVAAAFLNRFSAGTVTLEKRLDGEAADAEWATDATFSILATCQIELDGIRYTVHASTYEIQGGQTLTLVDAEGEPLLLPRGTHCFIAETDDGGATASTVSHGSYDDAVVVGVDDETQQLELVAVNTFSYGGFSVTKSLAGQAADQAASLTFGFAAECVFDPGSGTAYVYDEEFTLRAGEVHEVGDLPVGSVCTVTETDSHDADAVTITAGGATGEGESVEFTLTADEPLVEVEIENTFSGDLASSGGDSTLMWVAVGGGILLLVAGATLLLVRRRRRTP